VESISSEIGSFVTSAAAQRWWLLAIVALAVSLFSLGIAFVVNWAADPVRRRLAAVAPQALATGSWALRIRDIFEPLARHILPRSRSERGTIERQLAYAGFRSPSALSVFYAIKTCLALLLPLAWLVASAFVASITSQQIAFYALLAGFTGLVLPNFVLNRVVERRQKTLRDGFPDALDMLVVCVESGLGLSAAIQRVADELEVSHPQLASELAQVNAETRAGVEREIALRNLAERTGLDDIRGLVGLLVQTLRFGTGIADSLRVYSEEFRDKRMQLAEEQAAKIGTKLIFPLVLCMFPGFFVVAIGPAILRLIDVFSQMGS
jgi:tight adherence protein C